MTLAKALAARERTGRKGAVIKHGGKKAATILLAKGNQVYDEVDREVRFLNKRIRNYKMHHTNTLFERGGNITPLGNTEIDWQARDIQRYERRRDERNEFLRSVHQKRVALRDVIQDKSPWRDHLIDPIPIRRPNRFRWDQRDPVGPHPPSTFRSIPAESQEEINWLGSAGSRGVPWEPPF